MINTDKRIFELAEEGAKKNNRFICVGKKADGREVVSSEVFLDSIAKAAYALYDCGVRPGEKVALFAENNVKWPIIDLAIMSIGAITVPIYPTQPEEQIDFIIEHAECVAFIVSGSRLAERAAAVTAEKAFKVCVSFDNKPEEPYYGFEDFLLRGARAAERNPDLLEALRCAVRADDIAKISYTSGTTGVPKGVILTHRNLSHGVQAPVPRCFHSANFNLQTDTVLSILPFSHIFEHCALYGYIASAMPVFIVSEPDLIKEALQEERPIHFTAVPRLLEKIHKNIELKLRSTEGFSGKLAKAALDVIANDKKGLKAWLLHKLADRLIYKKIRDGLGGRLAGITSGGAALPPAVEKFFNAVGVPVAQGYGLTETSPGVCMYEKGKIAFSSVGTPLEGVTIELDEEGEIIISGPNVSPGYYKEPELTAEAFKDGKFYTGDLGRFDEKGNLFIIGRKKELLKLSTGKYVAPVPIEDKLCAYPFIDQAVIVGDNQKFCGVLLVLAPDTPFGKDSGQDMKIRDDIKKAVQEVNATLAPWERVKRFAIMKEPMTIESGELTVTFKKKRRIILEKRGQFLDEIFGTGNEI